MRLRIYVLHIEEIFQKLHHHPTVPQFSPAQNRGPIRIILNIDVRYSEVSQHQLDNQSWTWEDRFVHCISWGNTVHCKP